MNTAKNSIIKLIQLYSHSTKKISPHKVSILSYLQDAAESQPLRPIEMELTFKLKMSDCDFGNKPKSTESKESNKAHESH